MTPRLWKPLLLGLIAALTVAPSLTGYAHFIRYAAPGAFSPIPDKFDLASLPDKTVPLFIADQRRNVQLAPGDSFEAVVSQIRAAARVWNSVESSDLRVAFSGLTSPGVQMSSPWIEVSFSDEIAPGIVAMGGPVSRGEPVQNNGGTFAPIQKSVVILRGDLRTRPSHTERFFLTLVHELGHALGLQHSWAGGVMATEITRGVTRSAPLSNDDVAGISSLYPAASFAQKFGSITGTVTMNGQPVHLASVVAIAPNRTPISALTRPDGTYRIEGVPQGSWYVYTHPLPPSLPGEQQPVNLELPWTPEGRLAPGPVFDTVFTGGASVPQEVLVVAPGQPLEAVNFSVQRRDAVNLHSVQTYSFFGQESVKPGYFLASGGLGSLVLTGYGLISNGAPAAGLSARILGSPTSLPSNSLRPYPGSSSYMIVDVPLEAQTAGPRHLIFQLNGETLVVPAAFHTTLQPPPSITSVAARPEQSAVIEGRQLSAATRILFDGVQAAVRSVEDGRLTVAVPPSVAGSRSVVIAENPDGQSSLFGASSQPASFVHDNGDAPLISISPTALPAGVESLVEITILNGKLNGELLSGGFSSADVQIRRIWATAPDKALALVSISPLASPSVLTFTIANGLQLATSPQLFQVQPARQTAYIQASALRSTSIRAGTAFSVPLVNVGSSIPASAISASVGGQQAAVIDYQGGVVTIGVPAGMSPGLATLNILVFGQPLLPSAIQIDPSPPSILSLYLPGGALVSSTNQPRPGESLLIQVAVPADLSGALESIQWKVQSGEIEHVITAVTPSQLQPSMLTLTVTLSQQMPVFVPTQLTVSANGRASSPVTITLRP